MLYLRVCCVKGGYSQNLRFLAINESLPDRRQDVRFGVS